MKTERAPEIDEIRILIAALQKSKAKDGWVVIRNLENVPELPGHWCLYDGLDIRSGGVSWNTNEAIKKSACLTTCERPIYAYLPDADGSAAQYLGEAGFHE